MNLESEVKSAFRRGGLIASGERVLVGVSGGPDSVALLHALWRTAARGNLRVLHVHHGLRGAEADRDAVFVERMAVRLGVGVTVKRLRRANLTEGEARELRYRAFREVADAEECSVVATGHTAADQGEAVRMWLLRGTGTRGLAGIPASRGLGDGIRVVRPLLRVGRDEVMRYLTRWHLASRLDRTNRETRFLRNRIRLNILPFLEKASGRPGLAGRLAGLAERFAAEEGHWTAWLSREADAGRWEAPAPRHGEQAADRPAPGGRPGFVDLNGGVGYNETETQRILRAMLEPLSGRPGGRPVSRVVDALLHLARGGRGHVALAGGWRAERRGHRLVVGPAPSPKGTTRRS